MKKDNLEEKKDPEEAAETVIEPTRDFFKIKWLELWNYRYLLFLLVRRDFVSKYKQTVLGPAWFVLQPLMTTMVFTLVFGKFAKIPTDRLPSILFYLCGLLAWDYFAQCVSGISGSLISNSQLLKKVYFPRLIVPVSVVFSNLMKYGLQLAVFLGFLFYFKIFTPASPLIHPNGALLFLPAAIFLTALASLGVGLWICVLTTRFRDFQHLTGFSIQLWMYATPVIYPLSLVPERWKWVVMLNPMTHIVEFYRKAFFGTGKLEAGPILICVVVTSVFFLTGLYQFNKAERKFVDTL